MGKVVHELEVVISPCQSCLSPSYLFVLACISFSSWFTIWASHTSIKLLHSVTISCLLDKGTILD